MAKNIELDIKIIKEYAECILSEVEKMESMPSLLTSGYTREKAQKILDIITYYEDIENMDSVTNDFIF